MRLFLQICKDSAEKFLSGHDIGLVGGERCAPVETEDSAFLRGGGGQHVVLSGLATAGRGPSFQDIAADGHRVHDAALEGDGGGVGTDQDARVRRNDASGGDFLQFRIAGDQFGYGVNLCAGGHFRIEIQAQRRPALGRNGQLERLLVHERDVVEVHPVAGAAFAGHGVGRSGEEDILGLRSVVRVDERDGNPLPLTVRLRDPLVDRLCDDMLGVGGIRLLRPVDVVEIVVDDGGDLRIGIGRVGSVGREFHPGDQRVGLAGEGHGAGIPESVAGVVAVPVGVIVIILAVGAGGTGVDTSGRKVSLGIRLGDRDPEDLDHHLAGPDTAGVLPVRSRALVRGPLDLAVGGIVSIVGIGAVGGLEGVEIVGQVRPVEGPGLEVSVGDLGVVLRLRGPGEEDRRCKECKGLSHRAQSCWSVGSATSAASWNVSEVPA